jgi:hypothetical protein
MQQIGNIIKQINRKITMETETETFECSYKMSYPPKGGQSQYTIYVTKDNGIDMTIYGEVLGAERWDKGARLKVTAQPVKTSKSGKQYQTATSVELLEGEVAVPTGTVTNTPKDPDAQKKEKYRMTMSNLISSYMSGGKMPNNDEFNQIDRFVKKILDVQMNDINEIKSDAPSF